MRLKTGVIFQMRIRAYHKVVAVLAVLAAGASIGVSAKESKFARPSGGKAVAHRDGKVVSDANAPTAVTTSVGGHALEPTLGVAPNGDVFYAAAGFDSIGNLPGTQILRSSDGAKTWENMSPRVLGRNTMPLTLDPYVWVDDARDGEHARIFTIDLTLACSYMSFSDDGGESWVTNPLSCGRPVNDHQTLFGGPPAITPNLAYPNILYYCWNDVASSECSKSIDGGVSFHLTGTPAYEGYEPGSNDHGFDGVNGFCGGLHGHGHVGLDGTVYLPREYCGRSLVSISHDEGLTWNVVEVSKIRSTSQTTGGAGHPSVTTDEKGNVYYMWISSKDRLPYLSVSKDQGETWSKPIQIGVPGLKEANLPQIDALGNGKIAMVYYGSTNSPFPRCRDECESADYVPTTWNAYVSISADALAKSPTFYTGIVNNSKDPLVRGECGPGRCHWPYDFIDVEIGPDGIAYGAFVDGCIPPPKEGQEGCTEITPRAGDYEGLVTKLVGGPLLK